MSMEQGNNREHDYSLHYDTADIQVNEMKSKITKISCQENYCVCLSLIFPMSYMIYSTLDIFLPMLVAKYSMTAFLPLCYALYSTDCHLFT
jgi:hypothetical protein